MSCTKIDTDLHITTILVTDVPWISRQECVLVVKNAISLYVNE